MKAKNVLKCAGAKFLGAIVWLIDKLAPPPNSEG